VPRDSTASEPSDVLSVPADCYAQGLQEQGFVNFSALPYEQQVAQAADRNVWRYDIVCMSAYFHLTTDIQSNGGNVYILADTVTLDATIDTRVYRPYKFESFFLPHAGQSSERTYFDKYPSYATWNVFEALTAPNADPVYGTPKLLAAFKDYYQCKQCRSGASGAQYIARMPDGATPPWSGRRPIKGPYEGVPAPSTDAVNLTTFRSGSVFIVANKIDFRGQHAELKPKVVVAGLPGGLGGLGEPWGCTGFPKVAATCGIRPTSGSLSTPGGHGGPAGVVYVFTPLELPAVEVGDYISVAGGQSAAQDILQQRTDKAIGSLTGTT
jgi:hypothetical protein